MDTVPYKKYLIVCPTKQRAGQLFWMYVDYLRSINYDFKKNHLSNTITNQSGTWCIRFISDTQFDKLRGFHGTVLYETNIYVDEFFRFYEE